MEVLLLVGVGVVLGVSAVALVRAALREAAKHWRLYA